MPPPPPSAGGVTPETNIVPSSYEAVLQDPIREALKRKGRFQFSTACDNRKDMPGTAGLVESLLWPISPQFEAGKMQTAYLFGLGGPGLEPRTITEWVQRRTAILNSVSAWLDIWEMPVGYDGDVLLDCEVLPWFDQLYNVGATHIKALADAGYVGLSLVEVSDILQHELVKKIREVRPTIRRITEYGWYDTNLNFLEWHYGALPDGGVKDVPDLSDALGTFQSYIKIAKKHFRTDGQMNKARLRADMELLAAPPFYDTYWSSGWTRAERIKLQSRKMQIYAHAHGAQFYRQARVIIPLRAQRSGVFKQPLSKAEFQELFADAMALGFRWFAFWDDCESVSGRNVLQNQIYNVVAPTIEEFGGSVTGFATEADQIAG